MEDEKDLIIRAIDGLGDGENNTASEVREVLTRILNYTENKKPIGLHTKSPIENNGNSLFYSFRGFEKEFANLSFKLDIKDPTETNVYSFQYHEDHREKLINILKEITNEGDTLDFVLPVLINVESSSAASNNFIESQASFSINARISLLNQESGITIDFYGVATLQEINFSRLPGFVNAETTTSIIFHIPNPED